MQQKRIINLRSHRIGPIISANNLKIKNTPLTQNALQVVQQKNTSIRKKIVKNIIKQSIRGSSNVKNGGEKYFIDDLNKALRTTNIHNNTVNFFKMHNQIRLNANKFEINIDKNNLKSQKILIQNRTNHRKTIVLDLDQTLVHCTQDLNRRTIQIAVPVQKGNTIVTGLYIRPFCKQFLKQLSQIAEIIIFTASHMNYAKAVLNYLDPQRKYISHLLCRQECTFQKGVFLKDLSRVNRNLQDIALVDNSPFSYLLQINNGIPILPFYDNSSDRQLPKLLGYIKELIKKDDVRSHNQQHFCYSKQQQNA